MMNAHEMILNSSERANGIAMTASQTHEAANWIRDRMAIEELLLSRYMGTFQNYEWTDARAAIDLMNAEVLTLRKEIASLTEDNNRLERSIADDDHQAEYCLSTLRAALGTRDVHGVPEGIDRLVSIVTTLRNAHAIDVTVLNALKHLTAVNECWCAKTTPHRECYRCAALKAIAIAEGRA